MPPETSSDPNAADFVPTPKKKDPAAVHPGVLASRTRARAIGVGVVYGPDGAPKIAPDFIANLSPPHRKWVHDDLARHGWKLNDDNTVVKVEG